MRKRRRIRRDRISREGRESKHGGGIASQLLPSKVSKSKEMTRVSGATGGKTGAAASQFGFVTERGANGSSTSVLMNNTRLRADSNVAPYAPNRSPYDDKLAGT